MESQGQVNVDWKVSAKRTFRKWEWLRVLFNAIFLLAVAVPSLILIGISSERCLNDAWRALPRIIVITFLFFAWPAVELYARWLGAKGNWITVALMIIAVVSSLALVFGEYFPLVYFVHT